MTEQERTPLMKSLEIIDSSVDELEVTMVRRDLTEPELTLFGKIIGRLLALSDALAVDQLMTLAMSVTESVEETDRLIDALSDGSGTIQAGYGNIPSREHLDSLYERTEGL